jgi:MinD-like ATPase involved in chromosome partitioning or flagellar assembly
LDNSDQDQPVESGPAQPRSVWADMVVSGPDDEDEPEPEPAAGSGAEGEPGSTPGQGPEAAGPDPGHEEPGYQGPREDVPSWPASGLPPSFGQRATEGERPAAARPGSGYGGYRPLGSLPPGGPVRGGPPWEEPGGRSPEPGPEPQAEYGPGPGAGTGPDAGPGSPAPYGPWETYETGESYGWTGEYGVTPDPGGYDPGRYGPGPYGPGQHDQGAYDPGEPGDRGEPGPPWEPYGPGQPYGMADAEGSAAYYWDLDSGEPGHGDAEAPAGPRRGTEPAVGRGQDGAPGNGAPHGPHGPRDRQDGAGQATAYGSDTGHPAPAGYGTVAPDQEAAAEGAEPPGWQAESAESLTADLLLRGRHAAPPSGWRRALYQVSGGLVRAPQSAADRRRKDLVLRARTPVAGGHHRVAVLSLKGGVGKTTTTVGLGATLASLRGDRIIAVDANPDRGTLSDKLRLETAATVRDLLNEEDQIQRYADVRAYTTQSPSGLEVLASDRDPTVSVAFSDRDYADVARVLEHYYSVSITDCGTGLLHSAMAGVLRLADQIVLVSSPSVDGARSASATLDWLAAHHYGDLVRGAVVVLSAIRPRSKSAVDLARLEQHFAARCRAVVRIPYDAHLEEGAEVDLTRLSRATADAYLVLAAEVGDGFSWPRH